MRTLAIMIIIFPDVEELDFVGPYEALSYLKKVGQDVSVFTVSQTGEELTCANGLRVVPHYSFETAPKADWIIVPGGNGRKREMKNPAMLDFVRERAKDAEVVASVCTGAFILAAAGILKEGPATTYHQCLDELAAFAPQLTVTGARVERQGNVYMAAGVSAGIDMALHLCDRLKPGLGRLVAESIEYPLPAEPPQIPGVSPVMGQMCTALEQFLQVPAKDLEGIDAEELRRRLASEAPPLVLDVREGIEVKSGMIQGARHIPLGRLPAEAQTLPADRSTPIVTVCRSGHRSAYAALYLRALGYKNVLNLEYGMLGWQQA